MAIILACIYLFDHLESDEVVGMLALLASLAPDGSTGELHQVVEPLVVAAARRPDSWSLLERIFPDLCRLIEEEDAL